MPKKPIKWGIKVWILAEQRVIWGVIMAIDQKAELCNYWSTDEFMGNVGIQHAFM